LNVLDSGFLWSDSVVGVEKPSDMAFMTAELGQPALLELALPNLLDATASLHSTRDRGLQSIVDGMVASNGSVSDAVQVNSPSGFLGNRPGALRWAVAEPVAILEDDEETDARELEGRGGGDTREEYPVVDGCTIVTTEVSSELRDPAEASSSSSSKKLILTQ
jgi:hypothetical protein